MTIRLPASHNSTTRRYSRTLPDAFADSRAHCIEVPMRSRGLNWALLVPIIITVLLLALLYEVKARTEDRKAIVTACLATQAAERGNPAACQFLFVGKDQ
jgi:hypothetical protein